MTSSGRDDQADPEDRKADEELREDAAAMKVTEQADNQGGVHNQEPGSLRSTGPARNRTYPWNVDEEWRVNLVVHDPPTIGKPVSANAVRDLLRGRVGEEVSVTAGKAGIFLYAATADAAETAERRAQEVLAEQGLVEDIRLERWDPSRQDWVDIRAEPPADAAVPELPSGHERNPGRRRLRSVGAVVAGIIDAISNAGTGP